MNELVTSVNQLYSTIPGQVSWPFTHTHYVDINSGFKGHRFCEPGKTFRNNHYSSEVWIWNLLPNTPPDWKDPNIPEAGDVDFDYPEIQ
jgi:hypothetical protein